MTLCLNCSDLPDDNGTCIISKFQVVDYEELLKEHGMVRISDLAYDIRYVPLETNEECLIRTTADYHFTNDYIFVENVDHVLMFDRNGKFVRKIGKPGRGPGEIGIIRYLSVLEKQRMLVVQTNWARKLYYFSFEDVFIKAVDIPDMYRILNLPGHRCLYFDQCLSGDNEYMFALIDSDGDTLDVVNNHYKWENTKRFNGSVVYDNFRPFYSYEKKFYLKSMHNDTVYCVDGDSIRATYYINLGKYKLPQEYRAEVINAHPRLWIKEYNRLNKGYWYASVFQAGNNLFITSGDYADENQLKLICPKDMKQGKLVVDIHNNPAGITNDIDGGPDFWPLKAINDSVVYMPILSHTFCSEDNQEAFRNNKAIDPQKKADLLEMLKDIGENDNPVLMIVNLK